MVRKQVIVFASICLFLTVQTAYGQKIKYKDLFLLLNAKKYEDAGPILKRFLEDPKNVEHANAHLQMGMYYQFLLAKTDFLVDKNKIDHFYDSSKLYFQKALTLINEKEVKKRDQYYEDFYRRDLRTGKFGIKLSDVQFDVKKRIEQIEVYNATVNRLYVQYIRSKRNYSLAQQKYTALIAKFKDRQHFLLLADETTILDLDSLGNYYDSAVVSFDLYTDIVKDLSQSMYKQKRRERILEVFPEDGVDTVNFLDPELELWNYKKWANREKEYIEKEVWVIKDRLNIYNKELDHLAERLKEDSVSVTKDLIKLVDGLVEDQLKKIDPDPMPLAVIDYKIAELEYYTYFHEDFYDNDSSDVFYQYDIRLNNLSRAQKLDSIAKHLTSFNLKEEYSVYPDFFAKGFETQEDLSIFIKKCLDHGIEVKQTSNKMLEALESRKQYLTYQSDTLLFANAEMNFSVDTLNNQYHLLWGNALQAPGQDWVLGLTMHKDSTLTLFQARYGNSFNIDSIQYFDLHEFYTGAAQLEKLSVQVLELESDTLNQYYFIKDNIPVKETYSGVLIRAQRGKLLWNKKIKTDYKPVGIEVSEEIVIVNALSNNENSPTNEPVRLVRFDLLGNLKQED